MTSYFFNNKKIYINFLTKGQHVPPTPVYIKDVAILCPRNAVPIIEHKYPPHVQLSLPAQFMVNCLKFACI